MRRSIASADRLIHPLSFTISTALALFLLLCDWARIVVGLDDSWQRAAYYPAAGGLAISVLAAAPGFIDVLTGPRGISRSTFLRTAFNLVMAALYGASLWLRMDDTVTMGLLLLSLTIVATVSLEGWFQREPFRPGAGVRAEARPEVAPQGNKAVRHPVHA